jgi:hypothetical protein
MHRLLVTTLLAAAAALAPGVAAAANVRVATAAELTAAIAAAVPGTTIALAPGSYGEVAVVGRGGPGADIALAGEPGATIAGMTITGSQRIVVSGLNVVPDGAPAQISVASSSVVSFSAVHLDGGAGGAGAAIDLAPSAVSVAIIDSTFLHCASPFCIKAAGPGVLIQHDTFDSLDDTDAVHGFGSGIIRFNHMDHALPHGNGNHNDFVQIGDGGPWTIDANWMGVRTNGAASIWVDQIDGGHIHDVVISNNVVTGHEPGQYVGIFVGGDGTSAALLPRNVTVINNTVISGLATSLRFGQAYTTLPVDERPLVVNNTGERLMGQCDRIRTSHNVFAVGEACSASDVIGDPHLDAAGNPTAASTLLINRGDPSAPATDYLGNARTVGLPDIGAIEFGASPSAVLAPPRKLAGPRLVTVTLRRTSHRLAIRVRTSNSTRFTVTALRTGKAVAKATHAGSAGRGILVTLKTPRRGLLVIRIRIGGPGGTLVRSLASRARP